MTFRRVMFWSLAPAVVLLAEALSGLFFLADPAQLTTVLFYAVFGYVLLGSMTLNSWLALRHPDSLGTRLLPRTMAIVNAALYAAAAGWLVAGWQSTTHSRDFVRDTTLADNVALLLCVPLMVLSVVAFFLTVRRPLEPAASYSRERVSLRAAAALIVFIVLASGTIAVYFSARTPETDGFWTFTLMVMGLPWSHTQYLAIGMPLAFAGGQDIVTSTLVVPIAVNIALAAGLLLFARFRAAATNWFFRLGVRPRPDVDAQAED